MNEKIYEFKNDIIRITVAVICVILSHLNITLFNVDLSYVALILCGIPIVYGSIVGLVKEHDIKADVLVSIAIIASIYIGQVFAAAEIAVIMEIGGLLEEITVSTTKFRIEKLIELQPSQARLLKDNTEEMVDALVIKKDDIIKINPGETIPADGIIIKGSTTVNQSLITGESLPVDKTVDDEIYAGTINNYGQIVVKVTADGQSNSLQKLISLIENVNNEDTPIIRQADEMANWVVGISFTMAIYTLFVTNSIVNAVTVLVVFCPCALILATPTAIIAAIGNLSNHGILVKNAAIMESLYKTDNIIFDKTGTITTGMPEVVDVQTYNNTSEEELLRITASAEKNYDHPLSEAIIDYYEKYDDELYPVKDFEVELGLGITCKINNKECLIGNEKLFNKNNITIPEELHQKDQSATIIYSYYDDEFMGMFSIKDTPKKGIETLVKSLEEQGYNVSLLTGDNESVANDIAQKVNISDVHSNCLPEDKLEFVDDLRRRLKKVIMVGDGINDASALKRANVGVAMGNIGSDVTIDSADIVFLNDDVNSISHVLKMSKKTYRTIKFGIIFSLTLNTIAMILGMMGILTPITGALVHNVGSVFVIILAAMLFRQKTKIENNTI
ncbi:MAG: cation-translocating P-type ATPase [Methanosphaera sp.]|nr:cation-translocating P-type ATPase [Methanosphaera sp.]